MGIIEIKDILKNKYVWVGVVTFFLGVALAEFIWLILIMVGVILLVYFKKQRKLDDQKKNI